MPHRPDTHPCVWSGDAPEPTSAPTPLSVVDPLQALLDELAAAQRDAAHPARFERAVAEAFRFLGFDVALLGQAGRNENRPLRAERKDPPGR